MLINDFVKVSHLWSSTSLGCRLLDSLQRRRLKITGAPTVGRYFKSPKCRRKAEAESVIGAEAIKMEPGVEGRSEPEALSEARCGSTLVHMTGEAVKPCIAVQNKVSF